jgi:hypothetical protein
VLAKRGDDLRIDWGYLYLAADRPEGVSEFTGDRAMARREFDSTGRLPESDDLVARPVLATIGFEKATAGVMRPSAAP